MRRWGSALITALVMLLAPLAGHAADAPSGDSKSALPPPEIKEEELQRVTRKTCAIFPWVEKAKSQPKPPGVTPVRPPVNPPPAGGGALPDMSAGDRIIRAFGDFAVTPGLTPDKTCLILNKDIEIDLIQPGAISVLRAQKFKLTQDVKTGQTELLEANGSVDIVLPERKGRGDVLVYETKTGPHGEIVKDLFTLEGNHTTNKKAVLWQGNDIIEADKFIDDRRLETFRALGSPAAIVTMPADTSAPPTPSPAAPAAPETAKPGGAAAAGMLPSFGLAAGGKIRLQCDGELFYEGPSGRVTLNRNAMIQQQGDPLPNGAPGASVKISSDEAHLILTVPPPGQPEETTSMFSGSLKTMECIGRVELKTTTHTVLCDRCTMDMQRNTVLMEMKNPKEDVHIYIKDDAAGGGRTMVARKSLLYNTITNDMQAPYGLKMDALPESIPTNRTGATPVKK
jgi:hypothetical protein